MKYKGVLFAACMALLAGCSGTPGESAIAKQIEQTTNKQFGVDFVHVDDLEKTNGRKEGDNNYIADVVFDLEYTKNSDQVVDEMTKNTPAGMGRSIAAMTLKSIVGEFKAGDTKHVETTVKLSKSENGWVLIK